jgi:hypothetical protein
MFHRDICFAYFCASSYLKGSTGKASYGVFKGSMALFQGAPENMAGACYHIAADHWRYYRLWRRDGCCAFYLHIILKQHENQGYYKGN